MSFKSFLEEGSRLTDREIRTASREMIKHYAEAEKEIRKSMDKVYSKYLATQNKEDYYNIMIQHDRLQKLQNEVGKVYTYYDKKAGRKVGEAGRLAMSNSFYRQQYQLSWQAPLSFVSLNPQIVEAAVFGTPRTWQDIPKQARERFALKYNKPLTAYIPQYGSLTKLLSENRRDDIDRINKAIVQGFIQGKGSKEMSRQIRDVVGHSAFKAERIMRTETTRLSAIGDEIMAYDAKDQGLEVKKMWMATLDDKTRDRHADLDGVMVDLDEEFSGGAMRPGDFSDIGQNINCRCVLNTVVVKDGEPIKPQTRLGRDPVTGENEAFSYRKFDEWAEEKGIRKTQSGEMRA